jgi:hypothetical protein
MDCESKPVAFEDPCTRADALSCKAEVATVQQIRLERITGDLTTAEALARAALDCSELASTTRIAVTIELAKTLDRFGLHFNTRPVAEASDLLRQAQNDADPSNMRVQADLALAAAELDAGGYQAAAKEGLQRVASGDRNVRE